MALPTTIANSKLGDQAYYHGPFISSSGNVYTILPHVTTTALMAMKATDPTSSFAEQNSAGRPSAAATFLWVTQSGDTLHMIYKGSGVNTVRYCTFNMATDTWGLSELVATLVGGPFYYSGSLVVRSDGTVVAFFGGSTETVMGTAYGRPNYAIRSTLGVWGTPVVVAGAGLQANYVGAVAILGASDRVHFFYSDRTNLDGYHRSLSSAGVLDTAATFDTNLGAISSPVNPGVSYSSGGGVEVRAPYHDSTAKNSVVKLTSGANPTLTVDVDTSDNAVKNTNSTAMACMAVDGTTLHVMYSGGGAAGVDQDLYRDVNSGSGWGTDTLVLAGTINRISCNVYSRGGSPVLAYLYDDAGTVNYGEVSLSSGPQTYNETSRQISSTATVTRTGGVTHQEVDRVFATAAAVASSSGLFYNESNLVVGTSATSSQSALLTIGELVRSVSASATVTRADVLSLGELARSVSGAATISAPSAAARTELARQVSNLATISVVTSFALGELARQVGATASISQAGVQVASEVSRQVPVVATITITATSSGVELARQVSATATATKSEAVIRGELARGVSNTATTSIASGLAFTDLSKSVSVVSTVSKSEVLYLSEVRGVSGTAAITSAGAFAGVDLSRPTSALATVLASGALTSSEARSISSTATISQVDLLAWTETGRSVSIVATITISTQVLRGETARAVSAAVSVTEAEVSVLAALGLQVSSTASVGLTAGLTGTESARQVSVSATVSKNEAIFRSEVGSQVSSIASVSSSASSAFVDLARGLSATATTTSASSKGMVESSRQISASASVTDSNVQASSDLAKQVAGQASTSGSAFRTSVETGLQVPAQATVSQSAFRTSVELGLGALVTSQVQGFTSWVGVSSTQSSSTAFITSLDTLTGANTYSETDRSLSAAASVSSFSVWVAVETRTVQALATSTSSSSRTGTETRTTTSTATVTSWNNLVVPNSYNETLRNVFTSAAVSVQGVAVYVQFRQVTPNSQLSEVDVQNSVWFLETSSTATVGIIDTYLAESDRQSRLFIDGALRPLMVKVDGVWTAAPVRRKTEDGWVTLP